MTYSWSTWLETALKSDPIVAPRVITRAGWQTAGRPSSSFSYLPSGIIDHHTACMCGYGHDPQNCINVIMNGNSVAPGPIAQLLGTMTRPGVKFNGNNFDPHIVVLAAGRCNHAGSGTYPWGAPEGNGSSIGIEWCGPVGYWPDFVVEFRARVTAALLRRNGWGLHQVATHAEYAPTRKVDPSGAWYRQRTLGLTSKWSPTMWREEVNKYLKPTVTPVPTPIPPLPIPPIYIPVEEVEDMTPVRVRFQGYHNVFLFTQGGYTHLTSILSTYYSKYPLIVSEAHPQGLKSALAQSGLTEADLVPTADGS